MAPDLAAVRIQRNRLQEADLCRALVMFLLRRDCSRCALTPELFVSFESFMLCQSSLDCRFWP